MSVAPIEISRPERWDVPFSSEMTDHDVDRMLQVEPFSRMDAKKFPRGLPLRDILKNDTRIVTCEKGDVIIREGDYGNSAFFILGGSVRVVIDSAFTKRELGRSEPRRRSLFQIFAQLWRNHRLPEVRGKESYTFDPSLIRGSGETARLYIQDVPAVVTSCKTVQLGEGCLFGELAALGRLERTATIVAEGDVELLEMRWQGLRDIMKRDPEMKEHIDATFRKNALKSFIQHHPWFEHLAPDEVDQVVKALEFETYGKYDWGGSFKKLAKAGKLGLEKEDIIAEEGHYPNGVIVIRNGLARISERYNHGHRTVGYLRPGEVFGFEEIAHNWRSKDQVPFQRTLRAIGYVNALVVPTEVIETTVLGRIPREQLPPLIEAKHQDRLTVRGGTGIDTGTLEFLVENRFINGTATMAIDLNRCTRCDDCVRACANAHDNNPRFIRHGPIHDHFMIANACMHCIDPVCMIECPTGAIHRNLEGGEVVINDQTCIGCTACANNCPYNAIRMVEIRDGKGSQILQESKKPVIKATKCDLCVEQLGGPACQRACPHDALVRVDMDDTAALASWLDR